MVDRTLTNVLLVFLLLMFGLLVVSVMYNYQLLQYTRAVAAWANSLVAQQTTEVAQVEVETPVFRVPLEQEEEGAVLGAKLSLLTDMVPYPVVRLPQEPRSVFAPLQGP